MKHLVSLVLALCLMILGTGALAAGLPWEGGYLIDHDPKPIDLDGDGSPETVFLETVPGEYDSFLRLHAASADGAELTYDTEIYDAEYAWAGDLDGDGAQEILLWGDVMSDDYCTWCLRCKGDHFAPVLFADIDRGENGEGYFKSGYGSVEDVDLAAGRVTLCGSQDMLGTYFMNRTLALSEDGLFEIADDGLWVREINDDMWDGYGALVVRSPIPYAAPDGSAGILEPGDKLLITAMDKVSRADFVTQDGRAGTLAVSEDYERGWGSLVDGIPEDEAFERIPYAD